MVRENNVFKSMFFFFVNIAMVINSKTFKKKKKNRNKQF